MTFVCTRRGGGGRREEGDFNSLCGFSDYLGFDFSSAEEDEEGDLTTKTDVLPVSVWR